MGLISRVSSRTYSDDSQNSEDFYHQNQVNYPISLYAMATRESHPYLHNFRNFCHLYDLAYEQLLKNNRTAKYCPLDAANSKLQTMYLLQVPRSHRLKEKEFLADLSMYSNRKKMKRKLNPSDIHKSFKHSRLSSKDLADLFIDIAVPEYIDCYLTRQKVQTNSDSKLGSQECKQIKRKISTMDYANFLNYYLRATNHGNYQGRLQFFKIIHTKLKHRYKRHARRAEKAGTARDKKELATHSTQIIAALDKLWEYIRKQLIKCSDNVLVEKLRLLIPSELRTKPKTKIN